MVRLLEILQKKKLNTVLFVFFLFVLGYIRHLIISNWGAFNSDKATYSTESIAWLRSFFKAINITYDGSVKMVVNLFFIVLFAIIGALYFRALKMPRQKKYFLILHLGLATLGIVGYLLALSLNLSILDAKSRDIIVFLQAPYTFVLIYFTHYLSVDTKPL